MRTPACYISRLGSVTPPHALPNLLKYWFFFYLFFAEHTHCKINIPVHTAEWQRHSWGRLHGLAEGWYAAGAGIEGNGKVGKNSTQGKRQQKAKDWTSWWRHSQGGTGFINTPERLRKDLPFLVLKTKELKKEETKFKYSKRVFRGSPSPNTTF